MPYQTIGACMGCGSLRAFSACSAGCDERPAELVAAGDYEALAAAVETTHERIGVLLTGARDLLELDDEDRQLDWRTAYLSASAAARTALARWRAIDHQPAISLSPERVTVWRCQNCGGVDAPQPCIGVCRWYDSTWIDAPEFDHLARLESAYRETESRLLGLLGRTAHSTPREQAWERSLRALQSQAAAIVTGAERRAVA